MVAVRSATPKELGAFAFEDAVPITGCPYAKGSKPGRQWVAGWHEARDRRKTSQ